MADYYVKLEGILENPQLKSLSDGSVRATFRFQRSQWDRFLKLAPHTGETCTLEVTFNQFAVAGADETDYGDPPPPAPGAYDLDGQPLVKAHLPGIDPDEADNHGEKMTLEEYEEVRKAAAHADGHDAELDAADDHATLVQGAQARALGEGGY